MPPGTLHGVGAQGVQQHRRDRARQKLCDRREMVKEPRHGDARVDIGVQHPVGRHVGAAHGQHGRTRARQLEDGPARRPLGLAVVAADVHAVERGSEEGSAQAPLQVVAHRPVHTGRQRGQVQGGQLLLRGTVRVAPQAAADWVLRGMASLLRLEQLSPAGLPPQAEQWNASDIEGAEADFLGGGKAHEVSLQGSAEHHQQDGEQAHRASEALPEDSRREAVQAQREQQRRQRRRGQQCRQAQRDVEPREHVCRGQRGDG
mmetsp:Transcript_122916/g.393782  ORF Transcript_122916/g.393782 Transcript_122916/m.393782 type:complete len:260 (-) Transcript_122916:1040-1819(-)